MTDAAKTNRRGVLFYGSAALAGYGLSKVVLPAKAAPAANHPHPDALLLKLGKDLKAAQAVQREATARLRGDVSEEADAEHERVFAAGNAVVDQIEATDAKTFDGLMVKVAAISWCGERDPFEHNPGGEYPDATTDLRLATT